MGLAARRLVRAAAFARAIAQRLSQRGHIEKGNIFAICPARRAGGAAMHPGGNNGKDKCAVKGRIAVAHRAPACLF